MTIRQILENLSEENSEIVNYRPEDYDYFINKFVDAKTKLINLIKNKKDITHYNDKVIETFEKAGSLISVYKLKSKAHQNTSALIAKHKEFMKSIYEYNKVLFEYKKRTGLDIKTIGDALREMGGDTDKGSVNTEE